MRIEHTKISVWRILYAFDLCVWNITEVCWFCCCFVGIWVTYIIRGWYHAVWTNVRCRWNVKRSRALMHNEMHCKCDDVTQTSHIPVCALHNHRNCFVHMLVQLFDRIDVTRWDESKLKERVFLFSLCMFNILTHSCVWAKVNQSEMHRSLL